MKTLITLLFIASTWQTYDLRTNTLTVHITDDPSSGIYFQGLPSNYDGKATSGFSFI